MHVALLYNETKCIFHIKHPLLFKILTSAEKERTIVILMPTALTEMLRTIVAVKVGTVEMASIAQVRLFCVH